MRDARADNRRRQLRDETMPACRLCGTRWPIQRLIDGCPTCKAVLAEHFRLVDDISSGRVRVYRPKTKGAEPGASA